MYRAVIRAIIENGWIKHDCPYCSRRYNSESEARQQVEKVFKNRGFSTVDYYINIYQSDI